MKNKLLILVASFIASIALSTNACAALDNGTSSDAPVSIDSKGAPSESFLSKEKRSIASSMDVQTMSAPTRGIARASHKGWDGFESNGTWEVGDQGVVGFYPIGNASLPIILSMLFIYFVYRSVSTSRRKNNL